MEELARRVSEIGLLLVRQRLDRAPILARIFSLILVGQRLEAPNGDSRPPRLAVGRQLSFMQVEVIVGTGSLLGVFRAARRRSWVGMEGDLAGRLGLVGIRADVLSD